jgi:hypothetical protein
MRAIEIAQTVPATARPSLSSSRIERLPGVDGSGYRMGTQREVVREEPLGPGAPSRKVAPATTAIGELQIRDFHIQTLKVLALTLLEEITFLEVEPGKGGSAGLDLQSQVQKFEAAVIRSALQRTGGRQRRAARLLGMKVTTLNTKIKRYKLAVEREQLHQQLHKDLVAEIS